MSGNVSFFGMSVFDSGGKGFVITNLAMNGIGLLIGSIVIVGLWYIKTDQYHALALNQLIVSLLYFIVSGLFYLVALAPQESIVAEIAPYVGIILFLLRWIIQFIRIFMAAKKHPFAIPPTDSDDAHLDDPPLDEKPPYAQIIISWAVPILMIIPLIVLYYLPSFKCGFKYSLYGAFLSLSSSTMSSACLYDYVIISSSIAMWLVAAGFNTWTLHRICVRDKIASGKIYVCVKALFDYLITCTEGLSNGFLYFGGKLYHSEDDIPSPMALYLSFSFYPIFVLILEILVIYVTIPSLIKFTLRFPKRLPRCRIFARQMRRRVVPQAQNSIELEENPPADPTPN